MSVQVRRLILAVALFSSAAASAGARPYAFVQGTEALPETGMELENWFGAQKRVNAPGSWNWWLGPVVGITDHVEAGLFAIFNQPGPVQKTAMGLNSLRLQVSWAPVDRGTWPVDVRFRGEVSLPAAANATSVWLDAFVSKDISRLNLTANVLAWADIPKDHFDLDWYVTYGFGASVRVLSGLQVGGELYGDTGLSEKETSITAGPSIAYGTGRIWTSASVGFGITDDSPKLRGRIVMGLSF